MATTAYLTIVGAKQGPIKGNVSAPGREGTIAVTALSSTINVPIAPAAGATNVAAGAPQHHPITITKPLDQATPRLYEALITNEDLKSVTIAFWGPASASGGPEKPYFTIQLTDANLAAVALELPAGPGASADPHEEIQLAYRKIAWTWVDGGITASDDLVTQKTT